MLRIVTLGRLHVRNDAGPLTGAAAQPRRLAVLALLAAAGDAGLTREKVTGILWPDTEEERARKGLNQALYALRQDLGADEVFLGTRDLRLNPDLATSDVAEFRQALAEGHLELAAQRYTGPFLDGFHLPGAPEFERWVEEERAGLARAYVEALERLARRATAKRDHAQAAGWWRRLAAQDPLNARVAVSLMRALADAGDRNGALQHARVYEALHEQELDAPADREVRALAAELRAAIASEGSAAPPTASVSPAPTTLAPAPAPPTGPESPAPAAPSPTARKRRGVRRALAALALLAAGATADQMLRARGSEGPVPGPARRVAFEAGLELDPALSPDGTMLAYAAESDRRFQIFVRQADGGRAVPVSERLPGSHRRPVWSPAGDRLAFQTEGRIYVVPALGGVPRVLVQPASPESWVAYPAWSPDGREIAYVEEWAVRVRRLDGGPTRRVTEAETAHSPAWSADGEWIAYVSGNPVFLYGETPWGSSANLGNVAPSAIRVVRARGGEPVEVTDARALNTSPVWLPDSRVLLFVSDREGSRDIWRIALGLAGTPSGEPRRVTTGLAAHSIAVSRDGRALAYSVFTATANVWTLDLPESGPATLDAARPLTQGTQLVEGIALSPDGLSLAFDSDREGHQHVYRMPADGGEPVQLTGGGQDDFVGTWSGDGRLIALHSYRDGTRRVRLVGAEGGEPEDVADEPPNQRSPGLAPDGRRLVFTADADGVRQLFVVSREADGRWGRARRLTRLGGWAGRWSPDGRTIVFCREDGVWLVPAEGGAPRPLVRSDAPGRPAPELAQWAPDGTSVYYKAFDAQGRSSIWSVPAAGGEPRLVLDFADPERPSTRPEFATDGRRLFFTVADRESDIWRMALDYGT